MARTERTKLKLRKALKQLMTEEAFSKITVDKLAQRAKVNRNSFYYHFRNTYDLLEWTLEQEAVERLKQMSNLNKIENAINFVLDYIDKNRDFCICAYQSFGAGDLKRFFAQNFDEIIEKMINIVAQNEKMEISADFQHFLTRSYSELIASYLIVYLDCDVFLSREQIIEFISTTTHASLESCLRAANEKHL